MRKMKYNFFNVRSWYFLTIGLLLIGSGLGVILTLKDDSIPNLSMSSHNNMLQQGTSTLVSSKTTLVKEFFEGNEYLLIDHYIYIQNLE